MKIHQQKHRLHVTDSDLSGSVYDDVNLSGSSYENVNMSGGTYHNVNLSGCTSMTSTCQAGACTT